MPVTVRELIVRATVVDNSNQSAELPGYAQEVNQKDRDQIITDCVDQVLQIINDQKER